MQLRDQPILDQFQDEIFRLPLESRLAILGPAGTGKTTTLIRRLRQKIDVEHLSEDEKDSIGQAVGGLPHAQSWLMFTPTELLKHYVREAFQREDVPAPDSRLRTWDEHRRELARRALPILRSAAGGTLVMDERLEPLRPEALPDQIGWFEDFDTHQRDAFFTRLADAAATIARGDGAAARELGADLRAMFDRDGARPAVTLTALAERFDRLRELANALGDEVGQQLRRPLAIHLRRDPGVLDDLARLLGSLGADEEIDEEADDGEEDGEED